MNYPFKTLPKIFLTFYAIDESKNCAKELKDVIGFCWTLKDEIPKVINI